MSMIKMLSARNYLQSRREILKDYYCESFGDAGKEKKHACRISQNQAELFLTAIKPVKRHEALWLALLWLDEFHQS